MIKCLKILEPMLKDSVICGEEASYIFQGDSFCEKHGMEILQSVGSQVAQSILQQKLSLPTSQKPPSVLVKGR